MSVALCELTLMNAKAIGILASNQVDLVTVSLLTDEGRTKLIENMQLIGTGMEKALQKLNEVQKSMTTT